MKLQYVVVLALVALMSCKGKDDKSDAYGNFETDETIVSAEQAGKLISFGLRLGSQVEKDELLAVVDTSQLSLQLKQAEAQLQAVAIKKISVRAQSEVLQEQISNLKIQQDRVHKLFADQAATRQQVDDVDGQMRVLEKQLESLNTQFKTIDSEMVVLSAQWDILKNQLEKCLVTSPMSGVVLEKYVEPGELVSPGKAIVKLGNLTELDLRVYVSGAQLPHLKLGQEVNVLIDSDKRDNQVMTGVVNWISPEAEFTPKIIQTKEERIKLVYAVKVKVKNDGRLKIGMPGEIRFVSSGLSQ